MRSDVGDTKPAAADVELRAGEQAGKRKAGEEEGRLSKRRKASIVVEGLPI